MDISHAHQDSQGDEHGRTQTGEETAPREVEVDAVLNQLDKWMWLTESQLRQVATLLQVDVTLSALLNSGLVSVHSIPQVGDGGRAVTLSRAALARVADENPRTVAKHNGARHATVVADVGLKFMAGRAWVFSDRELRRRATRAASRDIKDLPARQRAARATAARTIHQPDLEVHLADGTRLAIEVELSPKAECRWMEKLQFYQHHCTGQATFAGPHSQWASVLYLVADDHLARHIARRCERLNIGDWMRIATLQEWDLAVPGWGLRTWATVLNDLGRTSSEGRQIARLRGDERGPDAMASARLTATLRHLNAAPRTVAELISLTGCAEQELRNALTELRHLGAVSSSPSHQTQVGERLVYFPTLRVPSDLDLWVARCAGERLARGLAIWRRQDVEQAVIAVAMSDRSQLPQNIPDLVSFIPGYEQHPAWRRRLARHLDAIEDPSHLTHPGGWAVDLPPDFGDGA
ncbi:MAG: hypothetical protein F2667_06100 [Actinobacteria bacterium]|nr:hypothetical protein [Actinomycetota bacterium]